MKCGSTYTLQELGNGPKYALPKYAATRAKCLHQVYLRAPKLPCPVENVWIAHKLAFAKECSNVWRNSSGTKVYGKS